MIDGTVLINDYYSKNNSIGVMDSLLMNMLAVKSGIGYNTDAEPVLGDEAYLVNGKSKISNITGAPALEVTAVPGFEFSDTFSRITKLRANSEKPFRVGQVFYERRYDESNLPTLLRNHRIAYPIS